MLTGLPVLTAHQQKSGAEYQVQLRAQHVAVLDALATMPALTDSELTFLLDAHMIAARRCELRDAGCLVQAGIKAGSKTWRVTEYGQTVLADIRTPVAA